MATYKKIEEGLEHIKAAEKSLKTSLLKWRPDYEIAAEEYSQAATCFKNGKSFEQCKECLLKAAEAHKHNRSIYHAAKSLEQAILICKDLGDLRDVCQLAERACIMYQQHGSPDAGAAALDKAAKLLEKTQPDQALRLYQRAADLVMIEDSPRQAAEFMSKVSRLMVKLRMFDQAADAIRREIGLHQQSEYTLAIGRLAVVLVLVQLAREDYVAAEKAFKEWGNCCEAPEVQTLEMLLQGFDEEDPDMVRQALNSSFIKHMDIEYAKLARELPLPKPLTSVAAPKASVRENAAPSYVSPNAASLGAGAASSNAEDEEENSPKEAKDEDEFEGGLC